MEFQKKIIADIEEENSKRVARLNYYKSENEGRNIRGTRGEEGKDNNGEGKPAKKASILPTTTREIKTKDGKKKRQMVDDFFVQEEESE